MHKLFITSFRLFLSVDDAVGCSTEFAQQWNSHIQVSKAVPSFTGKNAVEPSSLSTPHQTTLELGTVWVCCVGKCMFVVKCSLHTCIHTHAHIHMHAPQAQHTRHSQDVQTQVCPRSYTHWYAYCTFLSCRSWQQTPLFLVSWKSCTRERLAIPH